MVANALVRLAGKQQLLSLDASGYPGVPERLCLVDGFSIETSRWEKREGGD